jgi:hypothetical protein
MARLALAVLGGVIGSFFGMPQLGFVVGSLIGSLLFPPQRPSNEVEGPRLDDLKVSSSSYGSTIPLSYGTTRLAGQVIWATDLIEDVNKSTSGGGGKGMGGGGGTTTTTYTYSVSFAVGLCKGPATQIKRIWADSKLIHDPDQDDTAQVGSTNEWEYEEGDNEDNSNDDEVLQKKYDFTLRTYLGTESQLPDSLIEDDVGVGQTPAYRGLVYLVFENMELEDFGNRIPSITAEVVTQADFTGSAPTSAAKLPTVVADLAQRSGLDPALVDTSGLDDTVPILGYYIARPTTPRAALQQLSETFFFDAYESDGVLKFRPFGTGSVVKTIDQDWMIPDSDDKIGNPLKEVRKPPLELPRKIYVVHSDPGQDFQRNTQYASRHRISEAFETTYRELPLVLTPTDARQVAEKSLFTAWAERETFETKLSQRFLTLDPTDVVELTMDDGRTIQAHLGKASVGADYSMDMMLLGEDASTFDPSDVVGAAGEGFVTQTLPSVIPGNMFVLNTPYMRDQDDVGQASTLLYIGAYSKNPNFNGGFVNISFDDGVTWAAVAQMNAGVSWGTLDNDASAPRAWWSTDEETEIEVTMSAGAPNAPASVTQAELLSGANAAAIGAQGRWEIVQFRDVAQTGADSYTLSGLLRGRRGTEWAMPLHEVGDSIVLLDSNVVRAFRIAATQVDLNMQLAFVPRAGSLEKVTPQDYTVAGSTLKPYAPTLHRVTLENNGDLTIQVFRRARLNGALKDGTGFVPFNNDAEEYEYYFLPTAYTSDFDPNNLSDYTRKKTSALPVITYTAAEMAADGFDPTADELHLVVYQMSEAVVRGYPGFYSIGAAGFYHG